MKVYAPQEINNAELVGVFESGSKEWHEARKLGIGGSEVGTILGLNPFESAMTLFYKKTGQIPESELTSFAVWRGNAYEQPLLDYFQALHPELEVFRTGTYRSKESPFLMANPDAIAINKNNDKMYVIEVKTARYDWSGIPPQYEAQTQHYMDVLGINGAYVIGDVGGSWYQELVSYDPFVAEANREAVIEFWSGIQENKRPEWDGSESTYNTMREINPDILDSEVEIDGGWRLVAAQVAYEQAQADLNAMKSEVLDLMGSARHAYIEVDGEKIRIASRQSRGEGKPYLIVRK